MWKEWLHIVRDPRTMISILAVPPVLVLLFGYALAYDVRHIPLAINDQDISAESRLLVREFTSSDHFDAVVLSENDDALNEGFLAGRFRAALMIPPGFAADIAAGRAPAIQIIIDGSDPQLAGAAQRYALAIPQRFIENYLMKNAPPALRETLTKPSIKVIPRVLYNPDLSGINFIVPGLISLILMMIPAIITSVAIVREKETGTIEQLIVSPVRPVELMLGKVAPYLLVSALDAVLITLAGVLWFDIPFKGDPWLLALMIIVYMLTTIGIGLVISTVTETQMTAQVAAFLGTMLPAFMLSGFVFPIESMPKVIQYISLAVPNRYFLVILRSIFLKGTGLASFWREALTLFSFGLGLLIIATVRFRKKVF